MVVIIFVNQPKRFSQPLSRANWIHCAFPILNFWKPPKFCFAEVIKYTFFGISNATHKLMFMGVEHWRRASFFVHPCMFSICNYTRICLEWVKVGKHTDAFCILWPSNLTPLCTSFPKFHAASKWKANKWAHKQFHVYSLLNKTICVWPIQKTQHELRQNNTTWCMGRATSLFANPLLIGPLYNLKYVYFLWIFFYLIHISNRIANRLCLRGRFQLDHCSLSTHLWPF